MKSAIKLTRRQIMLKPGVKVFKLVALPVGLRIYKWQ